MFSPWGPIPVGGRGPNPTILEGSPSGKEFDSPPISHFPLLQHPRTGPGWAPPVTHPFRMQTGSCDLGCTSLVTAGSGCKRSPARAVPAGFRYQRQPMALAGWFLLLSFQRLLL